ncbi:MAG: bifunctional folylpolyglutamate synthase/dihydrofolate synthase [Nitrospirae bacterium]|nr:bifunctional folylpolyglutamate synthase/dihydrofolate synthase [Nitrospirota bacterium]
MSYSASLEFLYGLQKHGIRLGLDTIEALLDRLGRPQDRYRALHIGGTNGKGSTAAMAAAVVQAAGFRVGLYTSPHLVDFHERIRVNGVPISEESVAELTERVRRAMGLALAPTFFEATTAMALQYFADAGVEVAVVEVGMGGRLDATNVLAPLVSAITNVTLDHQEYLGSTVEAIAYEKAGIIKPGVPVVAGRLKPEAAAVIRWIAAERGAPLYHLGRDFTTAVESLAGFQYDGLQASYAGLSCPLPGAHQLDNAACALAMLELAAARGLRVSEGSVRAGLRAVCWEGRLEVVERSPTLLLDGAHNLAAADAVASYLAEYRRDRPGARVVLVWGMMRDKDRDGFVRAVLPLADEVVVTQAAIPRAASVQELCAALGERAGAAHVAPVAADALARARWLATPDDLICVTGSLMLVGEVKALLRGCGLSPIRG